MSSPVDASPESGPPDRTGGGPPPPLLNWAVLIGIGLILLGLVLGLVVFFFELQAREFAPYVGLVYAFSLLLMLAGLVVALAGHWRERRRRARGRPPSRVATAMIDLGRAAYRYAALVIVVGIVLVTVGMGMGSYKVYETTESNAFCGTVCHQVMEPEYVAHQRSPHANIQCVECHVGEGPGGYFHSKIAGVSRALAMVTGGYQKPLPTPIEEMRPARETCEQCHWPSRYIGYRVLEREYHLADEENSPYKLRLLVKIGGQTANPNFGWGIHYHMHIANEVRYIARDRRRQDIAWVRVERADGTVTEYEDRRDPLSEEEKAALPTRTMDCLDCHNRPAHKFRTPVALLNDALATELISRELPHIKEQGTYALDGEYASTEEAMAGIARHLREYYREAYPEVLETSREALERAIEEIRGIYRTSIFPGMEANWAAYPDNIGHRDWPGCFRCHNENMMAPAEEEEEPAADAESDMGFMMPGMGGPQGETIFTDCMRCHLILAQGETADQAQVDFTEGEPFIHPDENEVMDEYNDCTECHSGGSLVYE